MPLNVNEFDGLLVLKMSRKGDVFRIQDFIDCHTVLSRKNVRSVAESVPLVVIF